MSRLISLSRNQFAIIDEEDFELVNQFKWYAHKDVIGKFYAVKNKTKKCKFIRMHNLILNMYKIDHINGNSLDNRKCNLRSCTLSQNQMNRNINKNSRSGYKGVSWKSNKKLWRAVIKLNRKSIHLGYFDDKEEAAKAYNNAAIKYFGEFAKLNTLTKE